MPIYRDKRSGQWLFDFDRYVEGQRIRRRQLLPAGWSRAKAEEYDRAQSAALWGIATGVVKPRHRLDDAVTCYLSERAPQLKNGTGVERELEQMRDWWTGRAIDELPAVCAGYASDQEGALAPATIRNRIAYLRSAARWAWKRHGMSESDPGARVQAPSVRNARDITISRGEMIALARSCSHRGVRAVIRLAYWTGARVGEILAAERRGDCLVLADSKNGTPRIIPLVPIVRGAARVPVPRRSEIDYYWPRAREACGLAHVRLHDLRHTAASQMVSAGVDLGAVGAVLGHKSAQTTRRYAHYALPALEAALKRRA